MKITVYAIMKNEEEFVERFWQSAKEADDVIVLDTGSTDNSVEKLRSLGCKVYEYPIDPKRFRFDDARNLSLSLVSEDTDICVCLDIDMALSEGWAEILREVWTPSTKQIAVPVLRNGVPDFQNRVYSRFHLRHGFTWHGRIWETIDNDEDRNDIRILPDITLSWIAGPKMTLHSPKDDLYRRLILESLNENPDDWSMWDSAFNIVNQVKPERKHKDENSIKIFV